MDDIAFFGSVYDRDESPKPRKRRAPTTPIGLFFEEHKDERITHWCKPCRRWHGPSCFAEKLGGKPT